MTEIREMRLEDCGAVSELLGRCFSVPWSEKSVEETMARPEYHSYVAADGGRLIGYIGMKAVLDEADIVNVAVDKGWRRRGAGRKLLDVLLKAARTSGVRQIYLEVRRSNRAAFSLYEGAGFRKLAVRKDYYDKPAEDALIMVWQDANSY